MSPARPVYVETHADLTLPAPARFLGARACYFPLAADEAKLQALCDASFAVPTGGQVSFTPLGAWAVLTLLDAQRCDFPDHAERGFAAEREVSFMIPGVWTRHAPGGQWPEGGLAMFFPYLFIDNPAGMQAGREIFGYAKQLAQVRFPDTAPAGVTVDAFGAKTLGRHSQWDWTRLLTLSAMVPPAPDGASSPAAELSPVVAFATELGALAAAKELAPGAALRQSLEGLLGPSATPYLASLDLGIAAICLRQFRDAAAPGAADGQSVVLANFRLDAVHGVDLLQPLAMVLASLESTPVARDLGLRDTRDTGLGVRLTLDMTLQHGRELWRAAG